MSNNINEYIYTSVGNRYVCKLKDVDNEDILSSVSVECNSKSIINFLRVHYSNEYETETIYFNKSQVEWLRDILNEIDLGDENNG